MHVLLDGANEFFYKTEKIAAFDSKTTHTIGLYLTHGNKEEFRYGRFPCFNLNVTQYPDIFVLLLT